MSWSLNAHGTPAECIKMLRQNAKGAMIDDSAEETQMFSCLSLAVNTLLATEPSRKLVVNMCGSMSWDYDQSPPATKSNPRYQVNVDIKHG
jgi:hypothetical protein